jgi:hypothetical protein
MVYGIVAPALPLPQTKSRTSDGERRFAEPKSERGAMYYSDDALTKLAEGYAALDGKLNTLLEKYIQLDLKSPRAQEFARQGFPRRLKVLVRCIANVFDEIPPECAFVSRKAGSGYGSHP